MGSEAKVQVSTGGTYRHCSGVAMNAVNDIYHVDRCYDLMCMAIIAVCTCRHGLIW